MLCRLGQLMYDTLLLASNMINPKNVTDVICSGDQLSSKSEEMRVLMGHINEIA